MVESDLVTKRRKTVSKKKSLEETIFGINLKKRSQGLINDR
jgi:hypothetical protein